MFHLACFVVFCAVSTVSTYACEQKNLNVASWHTVCQFRVESLTCQSWWRHRKGDEPLLLYIFVLGLLIYMTQGKLALVLLASTRFKVGYSCWKCRTEDWWQTDGNGSACCNVQCTPMKNLSLLFISESLILQAEDYLLSWDCQWPFIWTNKSQQVLKNVIFLETWGAYYFYYYLSCHLIHRKCIFFVKCL